MADTGDVSTGGSREVSSTMREPPDYDAFEKNMWQKLKRFIRTNSPKSYACPIQDAPRILEKITTESSSLHTHP